MMRGSQPPSPSNHYMLCYHTVNYTQKTIFVLVDSTVHVVCTGHCLFVFIMMYLNILAQIMFFVHSFRIGSYDDITLSR